MPYPRGTMEDSGILYTHDFLHVAAGADADCGYDGFGRHSVCSHRHPELLECFACEGYALIPQAVSPEVVARAREHVVEYSGVWRAQARCRPDDWRMHWQQQLDGTRLRDGHAPIADLLCSSQAIFDATVALSGGRVPIGVFYTQLAYRTPSLPRTRCQREFYHIDGEANAVGARFPDHFSLIVGIALSPQRHPGGGNFTVFPKAHLKDWRGYPSLKRVLLDVGDAFVAHPLLPHRGGRNGSSTTRELAFFRLQLEGIDYAEPSRAMSLLADPFYELQGPRDVGQSQS